MFHFLCTSTHKYVWGLNSNWIVWIQASLSLKKAWTILAFQVQEASKASFFFTSLSLKLTIQNYHKIHFFTQSVLIGPKITVLWVQCSAVCSEQCGVQWAMQYAVIIALNSVQLSVHCSVQCVVRSALQYSGIIALNSVQLSVHCSVQCVVWSALCIVQWNEVQCSAVQCSAVQCAVQYAVSIPLPESLVSSGS